MCSLHFALRTSHFTLYTPHSTLYTPHSAPCTLLSTLYTSHFTLNAPHSTLYAPHVTLDTPRSTLLFRLHALHYKLHSPHSILYTLHSTLRTSHWALHTLHVTLHILHSTLYTPHSTLYTPHLALHNRHFALYTVHSPLNTPLFILYPSHSTLCTPFHSTVYTGRVAGEEPARLLKQFPSQKVFYVTAFGFVGWSCFLCTGTLWYRQKSQPCQGQTALAPSLEAGPKKHSERKGWWGHAVQEMILWVINIWNASVSRIPSLNPSSMWIINHLLYNWDAPPSTEKQRPAQVSRQPPWQPPFILNIPRNIII